MENRLGNQLSRHLAHLKIVSRLLGHELHAQGAAKSITLSREELREVQTVIDLFIEEIARRTGSPGSPGAAADSPSILPTAGETQLVPARN